MKKKNEKKKRSSDDPEAELRRGLREHEKLHRERTSSGSREYGGEDNEDGQE
jgi:hypothetical protein